MAAKLVRKKAGFESIELFKDQIIGAGAFGAVCHAQCDHLPCAAKILDPTIFSIAGQHKNVLQFEQECKFIRTVQHPNIVQYLGIHYDDTTGQPVLLMEMMDENLTHFLESSPDEVSYHLQVNFCRDIVLALSFLHLNDIIHRNLSGNNVLLICKARAKVSDFGMARLGNFDPKRSFISYTMDPTTRPYIPPEDLRNNPNYDAKIDCFSFGVVAIQIMTQKFPSLPDHNKPPDSENADGVLSYTTVPEVERRKGDISEVDPNHPLLQIALPCLSNDSTQRPSAEMLYKKIKKLQESDKYHKSMSDSEKSRASNKGANNEIRSNQPISGEDTDASVPSEERTTTKVSNLHIAEKQVEEYHDGPIDGAEHPEAQDVIVIAAEVHTTETLPEQSSPSENSNQHPCNHHDPNQKSLKASGFDKDEEILGESVQKSQDIKPAGSSKEFNEDNVIPSPNSVNKNGDQSFKSIDEHIEDKEISKSVQNDNTEGHRDSPRHKNGAEKELRSIEESGHIIIQTVVTVDAKREGNENTVQDNGDEDVQQEMQQCLSENDDMNKKEERKPVQNVDTVENNLQEIKHDDASVTEQRRKESKPKDAQQPELESKHDNVSVSQQSKQENKKDESEMESKCDNADPQKQESKRDDVQSDRESKQKTKEGKKVQIHSGGEMATNSPEITVLSQATDSDKGATKPEITSEGEAEAKKRKRKFTLFSRRKEPKSKKDIKERQRENDKTEGKGSKTYGGGKKPIPPKKEKDKEKKKLTPKTDKQKQKKKERKKSRKEMRTLMLGLDAAGKTTILYRMKLGQSVTTIPTCGFNVETVKYNKIKFCIWDVGGQDKIRPLWRHYFSGTDGFVFIIDSGDRDRFDEAIEEFHSVVQEEEMKDAIILVLANKQDLPDVMNVAEIEEKMELYKLSDRKWFIQPTCGASGEGLFEGFEWLRSQHLGEEYSPATADTLT